MARMDWRRLLNARRLGSARAGEDASRSPFERDHGRILFSNAFRRLHNKTQVFPVPENDHVHSRLTHSLEVASVGRSLGSAVGRALLERHGPDAVGAAPGDIADVVAAACLAHDIGNPPFGHAGESAIGHFFAEGDGRGFLDEIAGGLDDPRRLDLIHFEGNAQGFRILARLKMYPDAGGMRLTAATLGAFTKYPQGVARRGDRSRAGGKKFGWFASEAPIFADVAESCGLLPVEGMAGAWHRHPLAFLMEAADDVCYHVLDLEDGVMLRLVEATQAQALLGEIVGLGDDEIRRRDLAYLRARAINTLVQQVSDAFLAEEEAILAGTRREALTDTIPAAAVLERIGALNTRRCYRAPIVLSLEQTGFNVIGRLLGDLLEAAFGRRNPRFADIIPDPLPEDPYGRILAVTDFVSGMTDRYALRLYQQIEGIALSSV